MPKKYIEPSDAELERGLKLPTPAHHAIARLMKEGFIRVVITTNFDRLLERALSELGVEANEISSEDQAKGMIPFTHGGHFTVKPNGDYLDPRILNTGKELESYSPEMTARLTRIFDEFGVIACGWSASCDEALRGLIERTVNRRYTWFWAREDDLAYEAEKIIGNRNARVIDIISADQLFSDLSIGIGSLVKGERRDLRDKTVAIEIAKRYLRDDYQRIQLHDFYQDVLSAAAERWSKMENSIDRAPKPTAEEISKRIKFYDSSSEVIVALSATIGRWSLSPNYDLLTDGMNVAAEVPPHFSNGYYPYWVQLSVYPARLIFYAAGMASLISGRPDLLADTMMTPIEASEERSIALLRLAPDLPIPLRTLELLFDETQSSLTFIDLMHRSLRKIVRPLVASDRDYDLVFGTFELYLMLFFDALGGQPSVSAPDANWLDCRDGIKTIIIEGTKGTRVRFGGKVFMETCVQLVGDEQKLFAVRERVERL